MVARKEAELVLAAKDRTAGAFASLMRRLLRTDKQLDGFNRKQQRVGQLQTKGLFARMAAEERMAAMNKATMVGMARLGGLAVGALGVVAAKEAITSYAQLERQMTRIGLAAGSTAEETKAATSTVANLAQEFALPLDQAYAGLDALVATGKSMPEALAFLPSVLRTAQAAGAASEDMAASAAALATSLKIPAQDMQKAFDQLVVGGQLGQFELKDMAQFLPSITASATKLGFAGLEGNKRLVAMLQTVRQVSGTSGEAATAVGDAIEKTLSPTVAKAFRERGINVGKILERASKQGVNGFEAVIDVLREATKRMSETERNMFISSIYTDKEARRAVTAMITLKDSYVGYVDAVGNSAGATEENLKRVLLNTQARVDRLSNSWEKLKNSIGAGLDAAGGSATMDGLSGFIDKITTAATDPKARAQMERESEQYYRQREIAEINDKVRQREADIAEMESRRGNDMLPFAPHEIEMHRAERARLLEARAKIEAQGQWAAIDAGAPMQPPSYATAPSIAQQAFDAAQAGEAASPGKGAKRKRTLPEIGPVPAPDPRKVAPALSPFETEAGGPHLQGWIGSGPLPPPPSPATVPASAAMTSEVDLSALTDFAGDVDRLRSAMTSGGDELSRAGSDAAQELRSAAGDVKSAAAALAAGGREAASAISAARPPAAGRGNFWTDRPSANANTGQSMPNAGTPGQ